MKQMRLFTGFAALSLLTGMGACAPYTPGQSVVQPTSGGPMAVTPEASSVKTHHVNFQISFPKNFELKADVSASFARLHVQGLVNGQIVKLQPTNPDSDSNGFVPINNGVVNVGADVPEGNNWVLTADLQINANPQSVPLKRVMGAFHVGSSGSPTVEVSGRTYLGGLIVSAWQEMKSTVLNNPVDLSALKDFCDGLTGASGSGDNVTYARLTGSVTAPSQLSGRALALALANGTAMTNGQGASLNPLNFRQTPYLVSTYSLKPGTVDSPSLALSGPPSYSADTGRFHFMDIFTNKQNNAMVGNTFYAVDAANSEKLKAAKTEIFFGFASLGHATGNVPVIYANTNGSTQTMAAFKQSDGSQVWSYSLGGGTQPQTFLPVSQVNTKGTPATTDDEDVVYSYYPAASSSDNGIYAVQGGVAKWFYQTAPGGQTTAVTPQAALAPDGNSLYVLTYSAIGNGKLVSLPTRTAGTFIDKVNGGCACNLKNLPNVPTWTVPLTRKTLFSTGPALGTDGTIYIGTYSGTTSGYLEAYNPDGTQKWEIALPASATPAAGRYPRPAYSPIVDRQGGHDVIYVFTDDARVFAIKDDGTAKWKNSNNQILAAQLGSTTAAPTSNPFALYVSGAPLVGVEPVSQARVLYTGLANDSFTNPKLSAVRDDGDHPTVLWNEFLGGTFTNSGFQLKDGYLYYQTINGGEGSVSSFQRIKVEADNLPADAPWPMYGGNPALTGRRPSDVNS